MTVCWPIYDGDVLRIDSKTGELKSLAGESELRLRTPAVQPVVSSILGRGLFSNMRKLASDSIHGASFISDAPTPQID